MYISSATGGRPVLGVATRPPAPHIDGGGQATMTERRMRVGVVYGGRSGEHEVSLRSAASIIAGLDPARYEVVPIAITKEGLWLAGPDGLRVLERAQRDLAAIPDHGSEVTVPGEPAPLLRDRD